MASRRPGSRALATLALAAGLAVLAAGVAIATERHDQSERDEAARLKLQRLHYQQLIEAAERRPPRVQVTYVQFPRTDLRRLTTRGVGPGYRLVPSEITMRLRTGQPPLQPSFDAVQPTRDDVLVRGVREGRVRQRELVLVALIITPLTVGDTGFRLRVERLIPRTHYQVYDLADLIVETGFSEPYPERRMDGSHKPATITWTIPDGEAGALVPLALLHQLSFPRTPANDDLLEANLHSTAWQITTGTALSPRRLFVQRPGGREIEITIRNALSDGLLLESLGGG